MPNSDSLFESNIRSFVGVIPPVTFKSIGYSKQLLLMFDKLAIDLTNNLSTYENRVIDNARDEIDWLSSNKLLTTLSGMIAANEVDLDAETAAVSGDFLLPGELRQHLRKYTQTSIRAHNGLSDLRTIAAKLRRQSGVDAVAIGVPGTAIELDQKTDRDAVIKITLTQFPIPSEITPWKDILDFKANSRGHFFKLKAWMNKIAREGLKLYEIEDELYSLINSYKADMNVARMKMNDGILETLVTLPGSLIEDIVKFRLSKLGSSYFQIRKHKLTLLEEEQKADGKEIAYIVKAKDQFKK